MNIYDVVEVLKIRLKSATSMFSDEELEQAVTAAQQETGWSLPISSPFRAHWMAERALRHCLHMLCVESAHKFKFKQINLQHRFDHYIKMVQQMDTAFEKIKAEYPEEFMGSLEEISTEEKIRMFGTYHSATFKHPAR